MEKFMSVVGDGVSKLPPGFRFEPTDEEIVFLYLARKTFSNPLPAVLIPDIDNILSFDPWELPGNLEEDRYFFSNKEDNNRSGTGTRSGYWKSTGSVKRISCSKTTAIVGIRKSFVFYKVGKHENGRRAVRTDWIMHEYYIALSENTANNDTTINQMNVNSQGSLVRIGNWTLCHIFLEKTSTKTQVDEDDNYKNRSYDLITEDLSDTDSCSASSSSAQYYSDSSIFTDKDEVSSSSS
ncbi:hypothetical protein CDL12_08020 [Handroanthus impetiginosus]|uniref:NAC domain-containing protein n=1 Tax=Handroanthus impetiginosus TaxID=429701 RepID=A0A2G9HP54_9LAMI|nr:hypothetical protein CDL12_08020 [Handroanthus impetiginosus]